MEARVRNVSENGRGLGLDSITPLPERAIVDVLLGVPVQFQVVYQRGKRHGLALRNEPDAELVLRYMGLWQEAGPLLPPTVAA